MSTVKDRGRGRRTIEEEAAEQNLVLALLTPTGKRRVAKRNDPARHLAKLPTPNGER